MFDRSPLVSVIIAAYNQAAWLPFAVESVLTQAYRQFEVIVVNDGSTDETGQILAGYGERIRVITEPNAGLSAARNSGLRAAHGELIGFLDSDDLWYPEMLALTAPYLEHNPDFDLVCGDWDVINDLGLKIAPVTRPWGLDASVEADFLRIAILGCPFPPHAVLVRRKCFDCCGVFDTSLRAMEDWDLWLRFAAHGHRLGFIDSPVASYRRHGNNMTLDMPRMEEFSQRVLAKAFANKEIADRCADLEVHSRIFQWLYLAEYCQEAGAEADLRRYIQTAESLYPKAPHNSALDLEYFHLLAALPHTGKFMRALRSSSSNPPPNYLWITSRTYLSRREYGVALKGLLALLARHPGWVVQKSLRKVRGR